MPRPLSTTVTELSMWMVTLTSVAVAGQRFVDRVVDHFVDQVMQAHFAGRADVHGGAQAHRLQAFQHFDTAWNRKRCVDSTSVTCLLSLLDIALLVERLQMRIGMTT